MPELSHLRAFVAVARERNFTRAGQRLHVAQQAVSRSVASLESQLGVTLLQRTTREVTLTEAGEALLRSGGDALRRVDAAFAEARALGRSRPDAIHVGVTPAVGARLHPRIAAALTTDAPGLQVTFREARAAEATAGLRVGELDLVVSRARPQSDEFESAPLAPSPAIAIVAADHRLADRAAVAVSDLDGETLVAWAGSGDPYTDDLVRRLARGGAQVEVAVSAIVGSAGPPTLDDGQFALRPVGWPDGGMPVLELTDGGVALPLWVQWTPEADQTAVSRLRDQLGGDAG